MSSGQPSVANGQSADENHVSSTSVERVSSVEPHSAHASGSSPRTVTWPSGHSQSGSWWPHQIWREMFQSGASSSDEIAKRCCDSGWKRTRPERSAVERRLLQLLHRAPPLQRDPRLDPRLAAVAERDRVPVRLPLLELVVLAQPGEDALVRLLLGQAGELARLLVHQPVGADHRQLGQAVVAADLVVGRVVRQA